MDKSYVAENEAELARLKAFPGGLSAPYAICFVRRKSATIWGSGAAAESQGVHLRTGSRSSRCARAPRRTQRVAVYRQVILAAM